MAPTPAGVPVKTTSPGSSVMPALRYSMISPTPKISWPVLEDCFCSPLTNSLISRLATSPTSSGVTRYGPIGPCVSNDLPIIQVGEWNCQSRTETSLPIV